MKNEIKTMKATIACMDTISIDIVDSNFYVEKIKITHDNAIKLISDDLLFSYEIRRDSNSQHMTQHMTIHVN